eukprot:14136305-Ditylum_brightwellii.AAC.1
MDALVDRNCSGLAVGIRLGGVFIRKTVTSASALTFSWASRVNSSTGVDSSWCALTHSMWRSMPLLLTASISFTKL